MSSPSAPATQGAVRELQNKVQVKWNLAEKYMRKAMQTSSVPQRTQATFRSKSYVHQAIALIAKLPTELRDAALAADPRKKK